MRTSDAGIKFIQGYEKCRLEGYKDQAGLWTTGWGHLCKAGEPRSVTQAQADFNFKNDLVHAEVAVDGVQCELTQNEFDALVSFAFNVGIYAFQTSTLFKKLNLGLKTSAAEEFSRWAKVTDPKTKEKVTSNGLLDRRNHERDIFLNARYVR